MTLPIYSFCSGPEDLTSPSRQVLPERDVETSLHPTTPPFGFTSPTTHSQKEKTHANEAIPNFFVVFNHHLLFLGRTFDSIRLPSLHLRLVAATRPSPMPRLHGFRGGTPLGGWASRVALLSLVGLGSLLVLPEDWHSQAAKKVVGPWDPGMVVVITLSELGASPLSNFILSDLDPKPTIGWKTVFGWFTRSRTVYLAGRKRPTAFLETSLDRTVGRSFTFLLL